VRKQWRAWALGELARLTEDELVRLYLVRASMAACLSELWHICKARSACFVFYDWSGIVDGSVVNSGRDGSETIVNTSISGVWDFIEKAACTGVWELGSGGYRPKMILIFALYYYALDWFWNLGVVLSEVFFWLISASTRLYIILLLPSVFSLITTTPSPHIHTRSLSQPKLVLRANVEVPHYMKD